MQSALGLRHLALGTCIVILLFCHSVSALGAAQAPSATGKALVPSGSGGRATLIGPLSSTTQPAGSGSAEEQLKLDREKFSYQKQLEEAKLDIERQKILEQQHALKVDESRIPWTAAATILPLIGVLLTVVFSNRTVAKQMKAQADSLSRQLQAQYDAQRKSEQLSFDIKAAEIIFAGRTPGAIANRGIALKAIFKNRLDAGFLSDYDPSAAGGDKEPPEEKRQLLECVLKYDEHRIRVIDYWQRLFPGDATWLDRLIESPYLKQASNSSTSTPPADDTARQLPP